MRTANDILARSQDYSDFDLGFSKNVVTNDLAKKRSAESVKQSVLNILLTSQGERPFMPAFGGNVRAYLFEHFDSVTEEVVAEQIRSALRNYEPRVRILEVVVSADPDRNALDVRLEIEILTPTQQTTTVEFTVERQR